MNKMVRKADIFWLALNGMIIDYRHIWSGSKPRQPLSLLGTLKVELSLIPGADRKLIKMLSEYGGWNTVMSLEFQPDEAFYRKLSAVGFDRERFDRSRSYILDPVGYAHGAKL